jgi:hypothetical protein
MPTARARGWGCAPSPRRHGPTPRAASASWQTPATRSPTVAPVAVSGHSKAQPVDRRLRNVWHEPANDRTLPDGWSLASAEFLTSLRDPIGSENGRGKRSALGWLCEGRYWVAAGDTTGRTHFASRTRCRSRETAYASSPTLLGAELHQRLAVDGETIVVAPEARRQRRRRRVG